MSRDPAVLLRHILLCLDRIADYTVDGKNAFLADARTQDAVIRNLGVIGQAVKDIGAEDLAARHATIPWRQVAGFRNVLAHQYLGVDLILVWNVVTMHLPSLRFAIESELSRHSESGSNA